jgi:lipoprotein
MEQKDIQAEKQLIQTWKSIMFLSWFTSIVGIGCWIQAGNEIIVGNMNKGVIWLIYI